VVAKNFRPMSNLTKYLTVFKSGQIYKTFKNLKALGKMISRNQGKVIEY